MQQAANTTTAAATTNKGNKARKATKPAAAPTLAAQAVQAAAAAPAAPAAPVTAPALPHGVRPLKQGAVAALPRNCPTHIAYGNKQPRVCTGHTVTAWQAVQAVMALHPTGAPAQVVQAALVALSHNSFMGYALRSGWLVAAPVTVAQ